MRAPLAALASLAAAAAAPAPAAALGWAAAPLGASSWARVQEALVSGAADAADLREALRPLALAARAAYAGDEAADVGQEFALVAEERPQDGMNAMAYRAPEGRMIVAFRGTTSESDDCADVLLFTPEKELPEECEKYSNETLDYVSSAKSFVEKALEAGGEGPLDVVFTGHSLGASLAQLMALSYHTSKPSGTQFRAMQFRAIAFAPAGVKEIAARDGFPAQDAASVAAVLVNPYDPVYTSTERTEVGTVCKFQDTVEPLLCKCCKSLESRARRALRDEADVSARMSFCCRVCFEKAHRFPNYMDSLENMSEAPECSDARR